MPTVHYRSMCSLEKEPVKGLLTQLPKWLWWLTLSIWQGLESPKTQVSEHPTLWAASSQPNRRIQQAEQHPSLRTSRDQLPLFLLPSLPGNGRSCPWVWVKMNLSPSHCFCKILFITQWATNGWECSFQFFFYINKNYFEMCVYVCAVCCIYVACVSVCTCMHARTPV